MTCPLGADCIAPRCKSDTYRWSAKGKTKADLAGFQADVRAYIQLTGERDYRRADLAVYQAAMSCSAPCVMQ